ncbi:AraC family transcriptional regulator N-terminal domain-containing protein [Planctomycetota bacterium]
MKNALKMLCKSIAQWTKKPERIETMISGLSLFRRDELTQPISVMYEPCICFAAQGAKRVTIGDKTYVYDPNKFLITSIDLPTVAQVIRASHQKPCLGLVLEIDQHEISQLVVDSNLPQPRAQTSNVGMALGKVTMPMLAAFQKLVDLLSEPKDIPILAPIIKREIFYRLLVSEQGILLRQIALVGSQSQQIANAIDWLKRNYKESLHIDDLASHVHMSRSTFHHHFRAMTAMSPLQYQKWLRLHEARRLMLMEYLDVTTAAFQVGYESSTQFSREYKRQFGESPQRDINNLNSELRKTQSEVSPE